MNYLMGYPNVFAAKCEKGLNWENRYRVEFAYFLPCITDTVIYR